MKEYSIDYFTREYKNNARQPVGFIQAQRDPAGGYYVAEYRHNIGWTTYGHYDTRSAADNAARERARRAGWLFNYLTPAD